jgi:hypothetical protein
MCYRLARQDENSVGSSIVVEPAAFREEYLSSLPPPVYTSYRRNEHNIHYVPAQRSLKAIFDSILRTQVVATTRLPFVHHYASVSTHCG